MKIQLVCEEMFDPKKPSNIYKRFTSYLDQHPSDALCIACSKPNNEFIEVFKQKYLKQNKGMIFTSDVPLLIYEHTYPLTSAGIVLNESETIYAMEDTICEIVIERGQEPTYKYVALDLFLKEVPAKKSEQVIDFPFLKELPKNGKPVVMPLQKFIEMIEENMDDDTREKIRKAKADFNAKTKS